MNNAIVRTDRVAVPVRAGSRVPMAAWLAGSCIGNAGTNLVAFGGQGASRRHRYSAAIASATYLIYSGSLTGVGG